MVKTGTEVSVAPFSPALTAFVKKGSQTFSMLIRRNIACVHLINGSIKDHRKFLCIIIIISHRSNYSWQRLLVHLKEEECLKVPCYISQPGLPHHRIYSMCLITSNYIAHFVGSFLKYLLLSRRY